MIKRAIRAIDVVSVASGHVLGWLVFLMMCMVLVEVVTRYVMQSPLAIADEMGGYMLVAITFLGLAYTWRDRAHVRVEFVVNHLSPRAQCWLRVLTVTVAAVFAVLLIVASWRFVSFTIQFGVRSGSWLRIPMKWPQMVLVVGSVLLFLEVFADLLRTLEAARTGEGEC